MKTILTFFLVLLAFQWPGTSAGRVEFRHLGAEAGLSQLTIRGLYQDELGRLWIGARDGIRIYDGSKVLPVDHVELNGWSSSSLVPTVTGDGKGHVFVNTDYAVVEYDILSEQTRMIFEQVNRNAPPSVTFNYGKDALWIGLNDTVYCYQGEKPAVYGSLDIAGAVITSLKMTSGGRLYAGTRSHGIFELNSNGSVEITPTGSEVITIYEDSDGNIWAGTFENGLYLINPQGGISNYVKGPGSISDNYVRAVCEDTEGNIWVGMMNGVDKICSGSREIVSYGVAENGKPGLSNLSVWVILRDNQGTMWFGTFYGGLDYFNPRAGVFRYYDPGLTTGGHYPVISAISEDKDGLLWLGTEGSGLAAWDKDKGLLRRYTQGTGSLPHNNIKSLLYDNGYLWIGTHIGGLCRLHISSGKFDNFVLETAGKDKKPESVHALARHGNRLFIGTLNGVFTLYIREGVIEKPASLSPHIITADALAVSGGKLWIAGNSFASYDLDTGEVTDYKTAIEDLTGRKDISLTTLFAETDGEIWTGTAGAGIIGFNPATGVFRILDSRNANLGSDYVGSLFRNATGPLLAGTGRGLSLIDTDRNTSVNYDSSTGFPVNSMMPGCIVRLSDGSIMAGGVNGMVSVADPDEQIDTGTQFNIWFSTLLINNRPIKPVDGSNILTLSLPATGKIVLKNSQNDISIGIGHDNFAGIGQPDFHYRLDGFDQEWIRFDPRNEIRYMNLPYGRYCLRVTTGDLSQPGQGEEISMRIVIRPPLYAAWYSILVYILLFAALGYWVLHYYRTKLLFRTSLELERRDKQQREEAAQAKLRFFANISHELRTPLTLILGQLELLLMDGGLRNTVHRSLSEIFKSSTRMNELVNELLDLLKYDQGMFRLRVAPSDIVVFLNEVRDSFYGLAQLKGIEFSFCTNIEQYEILFDKGQMRKVMDNLLSNAFKYTPQGGTVSIDFAVNETGISIKVSDSGVGIPSSEIDNIFERFYQAANNNTMTPAGTGIGLSLTRNIVEAHHGTITASSQEGGGSIFVIGLPAGTTVFDGDPAVIVDYNATEEAMPVMDSGDREFLEELSGKRDELFPTPCTILIVEDDPRLRQLLIRIFDPLFNIFEASDGGEGLELARETSPDLVLSDVMMPVMSGGELCRQLKNDIDTSHIPVILLTALGDVEHQIEGLDSGADDYIPKPFNVRLLVSRCLSILKNRRLLQEKFTRQADTFPRPLTTNPLDKEFIERAIDIVEANIENGNIDVSVLCSGMGISRTKLFLKMKGILGQTPHEFIQNIKLKVAARMLRENPEMNVSDITYYLGFSSLNYFGKYFRNYFGVSPSAYRKQCFDGSGKGSDNDRD